jgi:lauroyl-KDO2-lipid IV(A) myristoyltransferase
MSDGSDNRGPTPFSARLLTPRHWPAWLGIGLLALLGRAGHPLRRSLASGLSRAYRHVNPRRTSIIRRNLALCFPQSDPDTREQWLRDYLRLHLLAVLDLGRISRLAGGQMTDMTHIVNRPVFDQLRENPGIIFTVHSPGLEWAAATLAESVPGSTIYKPFRNSPVIDWWFGRMRTRHGTIALPRDRGMAAHVKTLKKARSFFYIADEDLGTTHGVFAPCFGH